MKLSRLGLPLAVIFLLVAAYVTYEVVRPKSEDDRYSEFLRLRSSFHRAASSRSGPIDRVTAVAHGSRTFNYFKERYEQRRQDLLKSGYFVQVGSFSNPENAEKMRLELASFGPVEVMPLEGAVGTLYRVRVGPLADQDQAETALQQVVDAGHADARLIVARRML